MSMKKLKKRLLDRLFPNTIKVANKNSGITYGEVGGNNADDGGFSKGSKNLSRDNHGFVLFNIIMVGLLWWTWVVILAVILPWGFPLKGTSFILVCLFLAIGTTALFNGWMDSTIGTVRPINNSPTIPTNEYSVMENQTLFNMERTSISEADSSSSSKLQNLKELKEIYDSGAITKDEFEEVKKEILE